MSITDFLFEYFIKPIKAGEGYNPINTLVYSVFFVFFSYLLFFILKKLKIKIGKEIIISTTPWIIFGIFLRLLEDMGIIRSYLLVTPNIWFIFFLLITSLLAITKIIERKFCIPYYKLMFISGIIFAAIPLPFFKILNPRGILYFLFWFFPILILIKIINWTKENKLVFLSQMYDATATFVSIQYFGYMEQHVLPRSIIQITGTPFSFFLLKLAVVIFVLRMLDKYSDDKDLRNYLKLVIGLLGFITGTRDILRLILLV
ncbi:MAG: DUF63 family protein [Candidatus Aenigmatarchaeota archaeon]